MNRVLIADDEKLSLNGIASIVDETDGFETVALAGNGLQAFELIGKEKPDILITDIRMPQKDGIWLIEQIDEASLDLPVIVISAYDDQKYLKTAIRSRNVYDYLFKPFLKEELQDTLKSIISYHKQIKETPNEGIGIANLQKAISSNDFSLIDKQLDEYFENSTENIADLKNRIYGWIMYVDHGVFPIGRSIPLYTRNAMKEVYESTDKKQLKEVTRSYLKECCERYVGDEEITQIVSECLRIIHKEMANSELNVNYCAYKLNVTPNYLSNRFSRDMQQSFSLYLNNLRMEKAKELLGNLSLKIYEIADLVGFSDVAYFNRVFKDKYSITPKQYRQNMIGEEEN